ncbi:unnamed protein product [Protopolystoma xenopodis]|uniref:Uncharacterized protein n=1 Tax=Protopolystoma xenopodis TaxID=117903 RepID=A0A3S5CTU7_9PLAT|nr:unnamed protein product [Protopolystoma xenopodis]
MSQNLKVQTSKLDPNAKEYLPPSNAVLSEVKLEVTGLIEDSINDDRRSSDNIERARTVDAEGDADGARNSPESPVPPNPEFSAASVVRFLGLLIRFSYSEDRADLPPPLLPCTDLCRITGRSLLLLLNAPRPTLQEIEKMEGGLSGIPNDQVQEAPSHDFLSELLDTMTACLPRILLLLDEPDYLSAPWSQAFGHDQMYKGNFDEALNSGTSQKITVNLLCSLLCDILKLSRYLLVTGHLPGSISLRNYILDLLLQAHHSLSISRLQNEYKAIDEQNHSNEASEGLTNLEEEGDEVEGAFMEFLKETNQV